MNFSLSLLRAVHDAPVLGLCIVRTTRSFLNFDDFPEDSRARLPYRPRSTRDRFARAFVPKTRNSAGVITPVESTWMQCISGDGESLEYLNAARDLISTTPRRANGQRSVSARGRETNVSRCNQ